MHRPLRPARGSRRFGVALVVAGLALAAFAGVALAKTFTVNVSGKVKVSDIMNPSGAAKTESVLVNSKGKALYWLTGDSKSHPKCLSAACQEAWPPLTVKSSNVKPSKASGIKGTLGVWHHGKMFQVTLNGHPLYTFSADMKKGQAVGEGVKTFGGIWHVFPQSAPKKSSSPPMTGLPPGY